jgi:ATP-dependent phosphofructokinase / diphosphate-dependent phosphofructokinase
MKGNAIIGQSGGPTSVINASLVGVVDGCLESADIGGVYGMRYGIEGFMQDLLVDLGGQSRATLDGIRATPSSALGSCRHKVKEEDFPKILAQLEKYAIRYFFLIGGNDTMDTIHRVEARCRDKGYEIRGIGVPKTVDNDLFGTDHTPGYGSAATYVARSVAQAGLLGRDMKRVDQVTVFQTVGREAGWLPAAAALAKRDESEAPHLIYMPERFFDREQCLAAVENCLGRYGYCSIVIGEGVRYADGTPVSASTTQDKFSNVEFGAMGGTSAAMMVHKIVTSTLKIRGEFQVTESLQMCACDRRSALDHEEAYACGREAVRLATSGQTGLMVSLVRPAGPYRTTLGTTALGEVAVRAKPMPDEYINAAGDFPTPAFLEYARPLVGSLKDYTTLEWKAPQA